MCLNVTNLAMVLVSAQLNVCISAFQVMFKVTYLFDGTEGLMPFKDSNLFTSVMERNYWWCFTC